jgi:hypothetical protein
VKISTILDQIDLSAMALPEFQRGYVWNRDQVRGLMHSLYRRHPVGSLLVWVTRTENIDVRGNATLQPGTVQLLLDGQQRITSLYGIIRGKQPQFFDGNTQVFTGLFINLEDETFEFYAPLKMKDNPLWVNVTDLMQEGGTGRHMKKLMNNPDVSGDVDTYIDRINAVAEIKSIELHIEQVTGEDKTVDVVVDIFNRVNSGGTKLSKGDLALAKICAEWPAARHEMKQRLGKWQQAGFDFRLEWLLRCVNAIVTGEALFTALKDVKPVRFREGLQQAEDSVDRLINLISGRLGLDHEEVLGSRYSFPLLARYLVQRDGRLADYRERDKLLYWYIHTFLWGRYAGSTESVLNQDLALIDNPDGALDRLIAQLRKDRVDLRLRPDDFVGWSRGARFYPLLYMLTRVSKARDLDTGIELSAHLLGRLNALQVHHIFPKALLYKHGYSRPEVNAVANFTFLTQETNLMVSDHDPQEYLPRFESRHPGVLVSHWIPTDPELWKVENYRAFLAARRELLARAANAFLDSLLHGTAPETAVAEGVLERTAVTVNLPSQPEAEPLYAANSWVMQQGLPSGEFTYELADPTNGEPLSVLDLAWPNGLQEGYSQPVALLLEEDHDQEDILNRAGYRYFTDITAFRAYVEKEILALEGATV